MHSPKTLIIKHLPTTMSDKEKEELLKFFGAKRVKCISSKRNKYNIVFASFENEDIAESVLHRLHQATILNSHLSVEFAKKEIIESLLQERNSFEETHCLEENAENESCYKEFINKLTLWQSGLNFFQPVPSHLKYQYPPPNIETLVNIIKVLATVPKFYTQVLHLMNKMNLPCPFGKEILPDLDLNVYSFISKEKNEEKDLHMQDTAGVTNSEVTSDSEISSDEDSKNLKETIPELYQFKKKTKINVPKFVKPQQVTHHSIHKNKKTVEEIFERVNDEKISKKIKLTHSLPFSAMLPSQTNRTEEQLSGDSSGFGYIHPINKIVEKKSNESFRDEREEERLEREIIECINSTDLAENRLSEKDRSVLPVFKNYAEGAPTCRLYIKNLAKTVSELDLRYIYNRYINKNTEDEPNIFDIRLMQEGRMKGQAFVTLQSVELAQKALRETNGYLLKDKPLVVQFARSATK